MNATSLSKWAWDLDKPHNCNVEQIPLSKLSLRFPPHGLVPPLYHEPFVIIDDGSDELKRNKFFQDKSSIAGISDSLGSSFPITLSSSNSFSDHRRTTSLSQYINDTIHSETLPQHLSNETWYLFGETFTDEWKDFLSDYKLPPCQTCSRSLSALSFGIGNKGSGVQWHVHGPGFSESLHGRKHWVLYPPSYNPSFNANFTSRHWMEYTYMSILQNSKQNKSSNRIKKYELNMKGINNGDTNEAILPWECTLHPGDMIYFPDMWYHATLNLDTYTAFVSTFTTEHNVEQTLMF